MYAGSDFSAKQDSRIMERWIGCTQRYIVSQAHINRSEGNSAGISSNTFVNRHEP